MQTEEFVGHREASRRLGVSMPTLRQRVRRGELTTFVDPLDERRKLLRVADLETLRQPRPAHPRSETAVTAA
jgi:hypothetical protein